MDTGGLYISVGNEKMHYLKWGTGHKLLLAFHGYANDAAIFQPFEPFLGKEYTILSFDLPHHGASAWGADTPLKKQDLVGVVKDIMKDYEVEKVSLMGYSMGGRVCLTIMEYMPDCVSQALLMATDGLTIDFYPWLFTRTRIGRKIFQVLIRTPEKYLCIADWMRDKRLIDESRHKFAMRYIKTEQSRDFLRRVWPGMSAITPHPAIVRKMIKKFRIPVYLYMGINDKVMPPSRAKRFMKGLETVKLHVLDRGHRVFDKDNAGEIAASLL